MSNNNTPLSPDGIPAVEQTPAAFQKAGEVQAAKVAAASAPPKVEEPAPPKEPAPTPEAKETPESTDDYTKFLNLKNGTDNIIPLPTEKPKTEDKPIEAPTLKPELPESRDMSDIPPEYHGVFKKMSNEAFATLKPKFLEAQRLQKEAAELKQKVTELEQHKLPDSYSEHPQAFMLTPEFQQQTDRLQAAAALRNHWEQQIAALNDGAASVTVAEFNQDGQLVPTGTVKVTRENMDQIQKLSRQ